MCGIVGYVGNQRAAEFVLDGLRKLEYRGYDSAGIATIDNGQIDVRRRKGKLVNLAQALMQEPLTGEVAIGHTRWATHGRPSDENAHPHHSDDIVVVHNGIIENFLELRSELSRRGRTFESETDTEIISHLIALSEKDTLVDRVREAIAQVRGAYAIAVIAQNNPEEIVVAKNASPLVIGVTPDAGIIASDIPALLPFTRDVLVLEEGEMARITRGTVELSTIAGEPIHREPRRIDWTPIMAEKGGYRHFMHKEIHEQPRAIVDTIRGRLGADGKSVLLDDELIEMGAKASRVMFTACGTSWHACLVGRLALEELARVGCEVELASELRYRHPLMGPDTLTVCVSQSGETADTLAAIREAKSLNSPVASIVNVLDSSIARESDKVLYTHAGPEIGVASTKAFVTQVVALYLFAIGVGLKKGTLSQERASLLIKELREIPLQVERCLEQEETIKIIAHRMAKASSTLFLGRGYGFPVALEGALKLKEISYIHAEGYAAGELKHGPIALIEEGVPIVAVATKGPLYEKIISNIQEVKARDGHIIAIASEGDTEIGQFADDVITVPEVDPIFVPLVATVPLQLFAYHVADLRGTDIDQPRNLAKSVTVE